MEVLTIKDMQHLIVEFADYLREERMRQPRTVQSYTLVMKEFDTFLSKEFPAHIVALDDVGKGNLTDFLRRSVRAEAPSKAAWNVRLAALRAFYSWLMLKERVKANPARLLERHRTVSKEKMPLSIDELIRLTEAIKTSRDPYHSRNLAIVLVLFNCALRVAEIVSIDLEQLDLENRVFLQVRAKGGKRLSISFNDVVSDAISAYLEYRRSLHLPKQERALFVSDRRRRISIRAVQQIISRYGQKAEISRPVTPHLLRHSCATLLAELDVPTRIIQQHLGHSSIITTERYIHLNGRHRREAMQALEDLYREGVKARTSTQEGDHRVDETPSRLT